MSTVAVPEKVRMPVVIANKIRIPASVVDLESFRRWARSDEFPEHGRICYLAGELWVDLSMEQLFSHNDVKAEFGAVLRLLVKGARLGNYFVDGALLSNEAADLSTEPDGTFVSYESQQNGLVRLVEGAAEGYVELEGTPDMVLEIVSESSVQKDTEELRLLYWQAGIPEYWLVDARGQTPQFTIFRHGVRGYAAVRPQAGWIKSKVFGQAFQLTQQVNPLGNPEYTLSIKP